MDTKHLRAQIRQRRDEDMLGIWLPLEDAEALCTEAELYRLKNDAAARRHKDGARVRKASPPKITLENADKYDESPGGT